MKSITGIIFSYYFVSIIIVTTNVTQVYIFFNLEKKLGNFKVVVTNCFKKINVDPNLLIKPPLLLMLVAAYIYAVTTIYLLWTLTSFVLITTS